jgi:hypothetical protein
MGMFSKSHPQQAAVDEKNVHALSPEEQIIAGGRDVRVPMGHGGNADEQIVGRRPFEKPLDVIDHDDLSFASVMKGTAAHPLTLFERKAALINL